MLHVFAKVQSLQLPATRSTASWACSATAALWVRRGRARCRARLHAHRGRILVGLLAPAGGRHALSHPVVDGAAESSTRLARDAVSTGRPGQLRTRASSTSSNEIVHAHRGPIRNAQPPEQAAANDNQWNGAGQQAACRSARSGFEARASRVRIRTLLARSRGLFGIPLHGAHAGDVVGVRHLGAGRAGLGGAGRCPATPKPSSAASSRRSTSR